MVSRLKFSSENYKMGLCQGKVHKMAHFEKYCFKFCKCYQCIERLDGIFSKFRSGRLFNKSPIKNFFGVRAVKSFGSDDIGVKGRELIIVIIH